MSMFMQGVSIGTGIFVGVAGLVGLVYLGWWAWSALSRARERRRPAEVEAVRVGLLTTGTIDTKATLLTGSLSFVPAAPGPSAVVDDPDTEPVHPWPGPEERAKYASGYTTGTSFATTRPAPRPTPRTAGRHREASVESTWMMPAVAPAPPSADPQPYPATLNRDFTDTSVTR